MTLDDAIRDALEAEADRVTPDTRAWDHVIDRVERPGPRSWRALAIAASVVLLAGAVALYVLVPGQRDKDQRVTVSPGPSSTTTTLAEDEPPLFAPNSCPTEPAAENVGKDRPEFVPMSDAEIKAATDAEGRLDPYKDRVWLYFKAWAREPVAVRIDGKQGYLMGAEYCLGTGDLKVYDVDDNHIGYMSPAGGIESIAQYDARVAQARPR
jgi:hypothetical protein